MTCRRVEVLLSSQLEGRLSNRETVRVTRHLEDCPGCRRLHDDLLAIRAELRQTPRTPPSPDAPGRIADRLLIERRKVARPRVHLSAILLPSPAMRGGFAGLAGLAVLVMTLRFAGWTPDRLDGRAKAHRLQQTPGGRRGPTPSDERQVGGNPTERPGPIVGAARYHGRIPSAASNQPPQPPNNGGSRNRQLLSSPHYWGVGGAGSNSSAVSARPVALAGQVIARSAPTGPTLLRPALHLAARPDDLAHLNGDPVRAAREWAALPADAWASLETRARRNTRVKDDFVQIPFPRLADRTGGLIVTAVESYKREAAVVDARLVRKVTLAFKATALSDLCDHLRSLTGIALVAGQSVADEKVTVFCKEQPLRDVMRQLSRPFGYTWLRSGKAGEYKYELTQDLRSQLLEEELRDRDRRTALLSLDKEIERFRPYRNLSPDEILARAKTASPSEKKLLEKIGGSEARSALGWGPVQMCFRLSSQELAALRAGETLFFSEGPRPEERPLPADVARGVLQGWRQERIRKVGDRVLGITDDLSDPKGIPVTAVPGVHATVSLYLKQTELGQYALDGLSGFYGAMGRGDSNGPYAIGKSPRIYQPDNASAHAGSSRDPALLARVSILPQASCRPSREVDSGDLPEPKTTSAEVLEAVHRATGLPVVADYYTRLFKPAMVTVRQRPLFDALNQLCDAMRMRWNLAEAGSRGTTRSGADSAWLQLRSTSFYDDRLKEVPNRLLQRWAAARREHGALRLEDLVEIGQLSDAQLDAEEMAEGARTCFGLVEWVLPGTSYLRTQLHYLAQFTPAQRQEIQSPGGLPFTRMSLAQQQGFLRTVFPAKIPGAGTPFTGKLDSLEDLAAALLRVDYSLPGGYEWRPPGRNVLRWFVPMIDGSRRWAVPCPVVREPTREAALSALRRVDPGIREALRSAAERDDPGMAQNPVPDVAQIVPTTLNLATIYLPGPPDKYGMFIVNRDYIGRHGLPFPERRTDVPASPPGAATGAGGGAVP